MTKKQEIKELHHSLSQSQTSTKKQTKTIKKERKSNDDEREAVKYLKSSVKSTTKTISHTLLKKKTASNIETKKVQSDLKAKSVKAQKVDAKVKVELKKEQKVSEHSSPLVKPVNKAVESQTKDGYFARVVNRPQSLSKRRIQLLQGNSSHGLPKIHSKYGHLLPKTFQKQTTTPPQQSKKHDQPILISSTQSTTDPVLPVTALDSDKAKMMKLRKIKMDKLCAFKYVDKAEAWD